MTFKSIDGRRKPAWNRVVNLDELVLELYNRPMSVKAIADKLCVSRVPITRILKDHGVKPRTRSEAMFLRMSTTSPDERKELARKANEACRGEPKSHATKVKLARSKSRRVGVGELDICEWLTEAGIPFEHQAPIDIYNVDFLIHGDIAVELRTGNRHGFGAKKFVKKVKQLLEGHLVFLVFARTVEALRACKPQLIADFHLACVDPPPIGEKWVVRCDEHRFARYRNDLGRFAAVECPVEFSYTRDEPDRL